VTRAVSFNIQHARRPDGGVDTELLATTCASFGADVLALQEVDRNTRRSGGLEQAAAVADACGLSFAFGEAMPGYGNALLVRGELADVETVALPHTPEREPRVAVIGRGAGISIACVHLGLRGDAVPQLPVVIAALTERPPPHLLLGDLNLERRKVAVWPLELVADPGPTFPSRRPRRRIDHAAVSGLIATRVAVLPQPPLSDHRPLLVELASTSP
jgi:endonuclease/exonuclease/phosphatase family metal-dependent hydrolase